MTGRLRQLAYGGDYNPEQWSEDVWVEDMRLMREAHVNLVTLGVFAWSRIQPGADIFDFGWLDRVMDLLHENGISVDLATATATPPPWLAISHPEMLPVTADGVQLALGSRQHFCPSSSAYREAAAKLVRRIAERYAEHPALAMWHVGNEYGCHVAACWCDESAHAFRRWLQQKYKDLDVLNEAWTAVFWSNRYSDWAQVGLPGRAPAMRNPSQLLDFRRFSSDALLECFEIERAILSEVTPDTPVTTNFMGLFKPLDYWKWAQHEDFVSQDSYPQPNDPEAPMRSALAADLVRSLRDGQSWLLMEQTTRRTVHMEVNTAKTPAQLRLGSYQALARGSDGIMFFQWRQSRGGAEMMQSAMVQHGPTSTSTVWADVVQLGRELTELDDLCGSRVEARAAILLDWESWWALEQPGQPSSRVRFVDQLEWFYRPLYDHNVTVDFVHPAADLSAYRLLLAPNLFLVTEQGARNLERFVRAGGVLVMSFFSGIVNELDQIWPGCYPAPLIQLLGLRVEDWRPLDEGESVTVRFVDGTTANAELWSELVQPCGAEVIATFTDGVLSGQPAVTTNSYGTGKAVYLATRLAPTTMSKLLRTICADAGVKAVADTRAGVEAVRRGAFLFLLDHKGGVVTITKETAPTS